MARVTDLIGLVEQSIVERKLCPDGRRVLVAVSGGVDSMVLLHVLVRLSQTHRWRIEVAHFNHQLRGRSSDADERLVKRTAGRLGVPLTTERGNVKAYAKEHGLSIEMAARTL